MALGLDLKKFSIKKEDAGSQVSDDLSVAAHEDGGSASEPKKVQAKPRPTFGDKMSGEKGYFVSDLTPFLPSEMIS